MKCPECGEEMEGQEFEQVKELRVVSIDPVRMKAVHTRAGIYYCENCDSEWLRLREKVRKIDGADRSDPTHDTYSEESGPETPV